MSKYFIFIFSHRGLLHHLPFAICHLPFAAIRRGFTLLFLDISEWA
jgi:hypothetical protein